MHLSTEDVEQVSGGCHVGDLHIAVLMLSVNVISSWENTGILVAKLEISLHSAGGMLWALSIVTVGEGHNEARSLDPFDFSGCDELIDNTLSVIGEITKLSFPHNKGIGRSQGVAVFKAKSIIIQGIVSQPKRNIKK